MTNLVKVHLNCDIWQREDLDDRYQSPHHFGKEGNELSHVHIHQGLKFELNLVF